MSASSEPGAARYGNFINYYDFNPAERRISLIPRDVLQNILETDQNEIVILDIGCNSGVLTKALYDHVQPFSARRQVFIIGVDLDPVLIQKCKEGNDHPANISFHVADILQTRKSESIINKFLQQHKRSRFDLVTCFSVTMWIHVNHGDDVFKSFLKLISDMSNYLILEPQPWKCYKSAVRRMKKLGCDEFKLFGSLTWNSSVVDNILEYLTLHCGMKLMKICGTTEWERKIFLLKNVN